MCSSFFLLCRHPLLITIFVTLQTLSVVLNIFNMSPNTWVSYFLILIFLGGLLVIFIYLSALVPNSLFTLKHTYKMSSIIMLLPFLWYMPLITTINNNPPLAILIGEGFLKTTLMFIIIYLIVSLFAVIFLLEKTKSPLKSTTYDSPKTPPCYKNC